MGASVVFGIALAFIPIEERPLDQWVVAFFKAIYRPTQFVWHKQPLLPDYFSYQAITTTQATIETSDANAHRKQAGLTSYMQTLPTDDLYNALDTQQNEQLNYVTGLFSADTTQSTPTTTSAIPQPPNKPQLAFSSNNQESPITTTQPSPTHPQPALVDTSINKNNELASLLPPTPATPNTITGLVVTPMKNPLENAIVEILDQNNTPLRATKTNKLGQFFSSTPLKNGSYTISVEAEGYRPSILNTVVTGEVIPPILISVN
jgi:hypothetical protein